MAIFFMCLNFLSRYFLMWTTSTFRLPIRSVILQFFTVSVLDGSDSLQIFPIISIIAILIAEIPVLNGRARFPIPLIEATMYYHALLALVELHHFW